MIFLLSVYNKQLYFPDSDISYSIIDPLSKYTTLPTRHSMVCITYITVIPVELVEYAVRLGIDVNTEPHLLHIAREGLLAELPAGWRPW